MEYKGFRIIQNGAYYLIKSGESTVKECVSIEAAKQWIDSYLEWIGR